MNKNTGLKIDNIDHIRQSIYDIIFTPLGSRIKCRDYGSFVHQLIDKPLNDINKHLLTVSIIDALTKWEKRIKIKNVELEKITNDGKIKLNLEIEMNKKAMNIEVIND